MTLRQFEEIAKSIKALERDIVQFTKTINTIKNYEELVIKIVEIDTKHSFRAKEIEELYVNKLREKKTDYEIYLKKLNINGLKINSSFDNEFWKDYGLYNYIEEMK